MRHLFPFTAALLLGLALTSGSLRADDPFKDGKTCEQFGTAVNFVETPSIAARQARKEEKLVLVLHVSGNFEDPKFT